MIRYIVVFQYSQRLGNRFLKIYKSNRSKINQDVHLNSIKQQLNK